MTKTRHFVGIEKIGALISKEQLARQQEDPGHVDAYVALMLELKAKHLS